MVKIIYASIVTRERTGKQTFAVSLFDNSRGKTTGVQTILEGPAAQEFGACNFVFVRCFQPCFTGVTFSVVLTEQEERKPREDSFQSLLNATTSVKFSGMPFIIYVSCLFGVPRNYC